MPTLGMEFLEASFRFATIVVPVALYFLLLGLLNTRRCPQLLTGRQDFALLTVALSPLVLQPAVHVFGGGAPAALAAAACIAGAVWLLSPRGHNYVIYNLSLDDARTLVSDALDDAGLESKTNGSRIDAGDDASVELSSFPALRNVSLRCLGGDDATWRIFAHALHARLDRREVEPRPMAVALLLVATAMIVAPLVVMAHEAPEIVRMLADLMP
jgi:hypothetical protein